MSAMADGVTPEGGEPRPSLSAVHDEAAGAPLPQVLALETAIDALAGLVPDAGTRVDGRAATDAVVALVAAAGRLIAIAASLLPVVEAEGWWALRGARSITTWLAVAARVPWARAQGIVRLGRAIATDLPETGAGAVGGEVPLDNALTLARLGPTTKARREALAQPAEACGEGFLVKHARELAPETFTRLVRRWAAAADPESDERGYRSAVDRECLTLSPTTHGVQLRGFLTTEHGASLRTALDSLMGTPAPGERRTTTQRRAQALADLSRLALDHGLAGTGAGGRVRPHLSCVVDHDTFRRLVDDDGALDDMAADGPDLRRSDLRDDLRGDPRDESETDPGAAPWRLRAVSDEERFAVAEVVGGGPVPGHVLRRLACDGAVGRLIFGPASELIDVGRAERRFTAARRRAIVARDQSCRYPDCGAPAALGELHHVTPWSEGGRTDANAGILLCYHHHDVVHRLRLRIESRRSGGWRFTTATGQPLDRGS
ncbi:HNH endonuclease signature motif containing protein [Cellulomonas composti]|uniref:HNH nuclease domain-containing protein n=1 Tax=Cellulomonas composti TaxID=266130 RepID=A0A511J7B8_9CELL|nr:HNH endonuclease signature motif containing protein [Cellulomonas composti]GEL93895.1 hypothetical protein CCO02nite_05530 [Cellulomonas composti]